MLYNLASKSTGRGVIVEIGSWKGRSTIYLSTGSAAGNRASVYAVDPHSGFVEDKLKRQGSTFEEFNKNVASAGAADIVKPIKTSSEEAAGMFTEPCELIFIDGSHEYQSVMKDFDLWFPKLIDGGIMAFHDTIGMEGPRRVARECLFKSLNFKRVGFVQSITFGEKVSELSRMDRLRNKFVLFSHVFRTSVWGILHPRAAA